MGKVVVIGAGQWGKNLVKSFDELGALAGVAEASSVLRNSLAEQYTHIPFFEDYREALSIADAFVIATPAHTHAPIAKELILAGKDVFVEKPITLSVNDAEELIILAETNKCILMVGHLLLHQPAIHKIKEIIESGKIGSLKSLHQERLKLGRVRSVENVFWSFGVHDLAVFLYLVGEPPKQITVAGQAILQNGIEDDVYVHLGFENDITAHLHTSWLWPQMKRGLTVIGTEGMIVYDEETQAVTLHQKRISESLANIDEGTIEVCKGSDRPLTLECKHFLECIESRQTPLSDGNNGLEVVRILEQVTKLMKGEH
ncbi:Gfo/Idh/MocA family protein [Brevibacillus sp. SYSU BS000544]|uniref:Gfo/Idh/MocA family protein n=1 Tax=Brevibacillus sp. SYSU BS000544 TaxID=3416443 RepID=UPI003CE50CC0